MSEHISVLTATSGEYEDYRTRPVRAYRSEPVAVAEAERMNALVVVARAKIRESWDSTPSDEEDGKADRKRDRVFGSLRRGLRDRDILLSEVDDLSYSVEGLTLDGDVA